MMNSQLRKYLEKQDNKHIQHMLTAITFYEAMKPTYRWAKAKYDKYYTRTYSVTIGEKDGMFDIVSRRLAEYAKSQHDRDHAVTVVTSGTKTAIQYSNTKPIDLLIGDHTVTVAAGDVTETSQKRDFLGNESTATTSKKSITFTTKSVAGRDAVVEWIEELRKKAYTTIGKSPQIYVPRFGSWSSQHSIRTRPIESVFGKKGQVERIRKDLEVFLNSEDQYTALGIPYHRGYLFYGDPGTGKSSIAQALANEFGFHVYYLPLAAIMGDVNMIDLVQEVPNRSVLLIEDIDVYATATHRDGGTSTKDLPTLAALLNSLDGVCTPHGLITFMTTNDIDALDPAVIRPGRADIKEEFGPLDQFQIDEMTKYLGAEGDFREFVGNTPAELMERIKELKIGSSDLARTLEPETDAAPVAPVVITSEDRPRGWYEASDDEDEEYDDYGEPGSVHIGLVPNFVSSLSSTHDNPIKWTT